MLQPEMTSADCGHWLLRCVSVPALPWGTTLPCSISWDSSALAARAPRSSTPEPAAREMTSPPLAADAERGDRADVLRGRRSAQDHADQQRRDRNGAGLLARPHRREVSPRGWIRAQGFAACNSLRSSSKLPTLSVSTTTNRSPSTAIE